MNICLGSTDPARRELIEWRIYTVKLIIYITAYILAPILFLVEFDNQWAAGGFCFVVILISIRLVIHRAKKEDLWRLFPPMSWTRALYQSFFFACGLAGLGLGLWQLGMGLKRHQTWNGESNFCAMIGLFMAAKWSFFMTIPIYELREDTVSPEIIALAKRDGDPRNPFETDSRDPQPKREETGPAFFEAVVEENSALRPL